MYGEPKCKHDSPTFAMQLKTHFSSIIYCVNSLSILCLLKSIFAITRWSLQWFRFQKWDRTQILRRFFCTNLLFALLDNGDYKFTHVEDWTWIQPDLFVFLFYFLFSIPKPNCGFFANRNNRGSIWLWTKCSSFDVWLNAIWISTSINKKLNARLIAGVFIIE